MPPFANRDTFQTLMDQVEKDPEAPIKKNRKLPQWLNDLILKCMAKDPDDRYETVQDIERQLATCGIADLMLGAGGDDEDDDYPDPMDDD